MRTADYLFKIDQPVSGSYINLRLWRTGIIIKVDPDGLSQLESIIKNKGIYRLRDYG